MIVSQTKNEFKESHQFFASLMFVAVNVLFFMFPSFLSIAYLLLAHNSISLYTKSTRSNDFLFVCKYNKTFLGNLCYI